MNQRLILTGIIAAVLPAIGTAARADEGFWPFDAIPAAQLRERYGFALTPKWTEDVQTSFLRVGGSSGAFVSKDGLVITVNHVGRRVFQALNGPGRDYARDGYWARNRADELKCPGAVFYGLVSIQDVTAQIEAAVPAGAVPGEAAIARGRAREVLEKASRSGSDNWGEIESMYQGSRTYLYRYVRYSDVRLVFAPEHQAAAFAGGPGDADSRYVFDVTFFRVYRNGVPVSPGHFLRWSSKPLKEGDLVFEIGNPLATERWATVDDLSASRDRRLPESVDWLESREAMLFNFAVGGDGPMKLARPEIGASESRRSEQASILEPLYDPDLFSKRRADEDKLRTFAMGGDAGKGPEAWEVISRAEEALRSEAPRLALLEKSQFDSSLFATARILYRAATELAKPIAERLPEYRDSEIPEIRRRLLDAPPADKDLERVRLRHFLAYLARHLGANDPVVLQVLAGGTPEERAEELISRTRMGDPAFRNELWGKPELTLDGTADPMIGLARVVDPAARKARTSSELQEAIKEQAYREIAVIRRQSAKDGFYPDACASPRLSFGQIKGFIENGRTYAGFSTVGGLFERAAANRDRSTYELAPKWRQAERDLASDTALNFTSTCDIVSGNSGSAMVNRSGELVGVTFGNIHIFGRSYYEYSSETGRAVSVDARGILAGLRTVYHADSLVEELLNGAPGPDGDTASAN